MTSIIGLLSWFDEPRDTLLACLAGLASAGVDHVVALDGRYRLYRADRDQSSPDEYAAILLGCRELGMACTISQPRGPWKGGEVGKRTALFALGLSVAREGDWLWVQDADQVVTECPPDLKERLEATRHDAAEVMILDTMAAKAKQENWPERFQMRALFRAQPIIVGPAHCTYEAADGSLLWGYDGDKRMRSALDLSDVVVVEHRPNARPADRLRAKLAYYLDRDATGIERGHCELCAEQATVLVATRWRLTDIGPVAEWIECCERHAAEVEIVNALELTRLGIDPDSVVVENRNGRAPAVNN